MITVETPKYAKKTINSVKLMLKGMDFLAFLASSPDNACKDGIHIAM